MMNRVFNLLTLIVVLALVAGASTAALGEEFFKGKTIRFVVGFRPGEATTPIPERLRATSESTSRETPLR